MPCGLYSYLTLGLVDLFIYLFIYGFVAAIAIADITERGIWKD
jgi:hypothetical protein